MQRAVLNGKEYNCEVWPGVIRHTLCSRPDWRLWRSPCRRASWCTRRAGDRSCAGGSRCRIGVPDTVSITRSIPQFPPKIPNRSHKIPDNSAKVKSLIMIYRITWKRRINWLLWYIGNPYSQAQRSWRRGNWGCPGTAASIPPRSSRRKPQSGCHWRPHISGCPESRWCLGPPLLHEGSCKGGRKSSSYLGSPCRLTCFGER